jgi:hypothetical protein
MTPFEEDLKQALRRQEPPAGFTTRLLARCAEEDAKAGSGLLGLFSWRLGITTAVAALLLSGVGGTVWERHQREVRGMAAKRQLLLAMRIAGEKLQQVQERVNESEQVEQQ